MDRSEFWDWVDRTRPADPDPEGHARMLSEALVEAGLETTLSFGHQFDEVLDQLNIWELWGGGYLLLGGLSDDCFEYLRCWIVGQGRDGFEQARTDAEGYLLDVVQQATADGGELFEALAERRFADGEALLYAAGTAHEALTGAWLPPHPALVARTTGTATDERTSGQPFSGPRPSGVEWDEDELPSRFPRLAGAVPDGWSAGAAPLPAWAAEPGVEVALSLDDLLDLQDRGATIQQAVLAADEAWNSADHAAVVAHLAPLLDDQATWALVRRLDTGDIAQTLAYQGGISRLIGGDPDGAASWLGLVADDPEVIPEVRRSLAQIELTRGNLEVVERLLETGEGAPAFDLAIATMAAVYRGDWELVRSRAQATLDAIDTSRSEQHPWDLAGMNVLVGQAMVEAGEGDRAMAAARRVFDLTRDAPPELPLVPQAWTLLAAAHRLGGDLGKADEALREAWDLLAVDTCDRGIAERESARCHRQAGREEAAQHDYARAVATLTAAGERWLAEATGREAASGS